MANNIISVQNLSYKKIFDDISLNISRGSFVSISGSNNCGKTTLIKILSGLIKTENVVKFNGKFINDINKTELFSSEGIVILNEHFDFMFDKVKDELMYNINNAFVDDDAKMSKYKEIIKLFGLGKYENSNPNELNRNKKVLLLLAMAVVHNPQILYLDNLDCMMSKDEKKYIMNILNFLNKERKMTIVLTTLDLNNTLNTDYLYVLGNGGIVLEGKPDRILKNDNVLNKLGLSLPFMLDLSIKLSDYDLIKKVVFDQEEMIDLLWK